MKNISICFIAPKAHPLFDRTVRATFGGAEVQLSRLAQEIAKHKNINVHMLVADYGQQMTERRAGVMIWKALNFRDSFVKRAITFFRVFRKVDVDVYVQRTLHPVSGLIALYCKLMKKTFVYMVAHDRETDGGDSLYKVPGGRFLTSLLFRCSDRVIVQNEYEKRNLQKKFPGIHCVLIKKGLLIGKMDESGAKVYDGIWIGRCERWKNPELFLDLVKKNADRSFAMICAPATGQPEYFEAIRSEACALKNLAFYDFLEHGRIRGILAQSRVFCLTSEQEGDWPSVVVEAAAEGLPVLSFKLDYGTLTDEYQAGWSCNGDVHKYNADFRRILGDERLYRRMSAAAIRYVAENHDIRTKAAELLSAIGIEGNIRHRPLISVVILSMNKTEDILACIASVKKQTYRNFNIIVVDNGSTDDTPDVIAQAHPDVYLIRNETNRGICTGRNQGFRFTHERFSPDYILQLDNDTVLKPDYMMHLLKAMQEDPSIGLACGKAYTRYPSTTLASAGIAVNLWTGVIKDRGFGKPDRGQFEKREYVDAAPGFGNLIRMQALIASGGWNTDYDPYGWDDTEICLRLRRLGYHIAYIPEARIYHSGTRLNRVPVPRYERAKTENYLKLIRDHASFPQRMAVFLLLPFRTAGLLFHHFRRGHGYVLSSYVKGVAAWLRSEPAGQPWVVARNKVRICIISNQILGSNKIGGFGSMTRMLARSLVAEGLEVFVVVVRRGGERSTESLEGFRVLRLSKAQMFRPGIYRKIDADIYHSQNQSLMTLMAELAQPHKKHIVTCRDPRNLKDWFQEFKCAGWKRRLKLPLDYLFEEGPLARLAVRKADLVGCPAHFLRDKARKMYGLTAEPIFLPNIEYVPEFLPKKSTAATVLFVGRLAGVKRPELFIRLAGYFPQVRFVLIGIDNDGKRQRRLENLARRHPNVFMAGFLDKFTSPAFTDTLNSSWILINTSAKESLPVSFVEAAGRGCAILSQVDPDGFASRFGATVEDGDYVKGLSYLLENGLYQELGRKGHEYVYTTYRYSCSIREHIWQYEKLLKQENGGRRPNTHFLS